MKWGTVPRLDEQLVHVVPCTEHGISLHPITIHCECRPRVETLNNGFSIVNHQDEN